MKIKRLTAGLAVAAMAATFFAAAPILSANAAPALPAGADTVTTVLNIGTIPGGTAKTIDIAKTIAADSSFAAESITDRLGLNTTVGNLQASLNDTINFSGFPCTYAVIMDQGTNKAMYTWPIPAAPTVNDGSQGTVSCATGKLVYTPAPAMGKNADAPVDIYYELQGTYTTVGNNDPANTTIPWFGGLLKLVVGKTTTPDPCATYSAVCLSTTLQAWSSKDSSDATSATLTTLQPNISATDGPLTSADMAAGYGLYSVDQPTSSGNTILTAALKSSSMLTVGSKKDPNSVTFTAPKNWSGVVTYVYTLAPFTADASGHRTFSTDTTTWFIGLLTFTVQPTLPGIDPIVSDPGAAVTIPVLEQSIIGSKPFSNAACTFADTKSKTTLAGTGSISNKGGSKDPIFTPTADFVGSVDLSCTVQDVWGITSNTVTVTVQVGAPAPAPVAPTTAAPACTQNCDGTLVSTGGSLAAPMSSGLAAVVLLVAAGAGILVVRRRTALAG